MRKDPRRKDAKIVAKNIKQAQTKRYQEISSAGRDIGSIPKIANKARRSRCEKSFLKFCTTYFPHLFKYKFSKSHLQVIDAIQDTAINGGRQAIAMPRSSGKSTLCEVGAIWVLLNGYRHFVMLIGSSEQAAVEQLESIKIELETNELLQADYPEALYPIAQLEGINKRCQGQTANGGERTNITWSSKELSLPTVRGSKVGGSTIRVAGITGRVRGQKKTTADGKSIRPDYVLIDDPQTAESSKSTMQCNERLKAINSDILGLGGVKDKIAVFCVCTVITKGDVADVLLDRQKNPEWHGIRVPMMISDPTRKDLWNTYNELRKTGLREDGNISKATEYYRANQQDMDVGCKVYWDERFNADELSAIQHAMNLKLSNLQSFQSEYQNSPIAEDYGITDRQITREDILAKLNGKARCAIDVSHDRLSMYIDIQKEVLWYVVMSGNKDLGASVVEYGAYPEQGLSFFDLNSLRHPISAKYPNMSLEVAIYEALNDLVNAKMSQDYTRDDGVTLRISQCIIDANWSDVTDSVYRLCRQSQYAAMLTPSHGKGITASNKPMRYYRTKAGERKYHDCILTLGGARRQKYLLIDTNSWKSTFQQRLNTSMGDNTGLTIYGGGKTNHEMLIDHLTAEYNVVTSGQGRTMREWKMRPGRQRNDWLDCAVGALVGLHLSGAELPSWDTQTLSKSVSLSLNAIAETRHNAVLGQDSMDTRKSTIDAENGLKTPAKRLSLKQLQEKR